MPLDPIDPRSLLATEPWAWAVPSREVEYSYRFFGTELEAYDYLESDGMATDIKPQPLYPVDTERISDEIEILRKSNASLARVNSKLCDAIVETAKFAGVYEGPSNLWYYQLQTLLHDVRSKLQELQTACQK